ncbi:MAG: hypothetical protein Q8L55_06145 [Phycisphaerales bacterium]|nr:hypothetical protein [Phycisphaerales bacterium]
MSTLSTNMLRTLLGTQATAPAAGPAANHGGLNFAGLLTAARAGSVTSDRPVEAAPEVAGKLTPEQLQRIAVAADHAESAGMVDALVLIDGQAVKLDVLSRQVTAVMDPRTVAITNIDGVLAAPPSSLAAEIAGGTPGELGSATVTGLIEQQLLARLGAPGATARSIR